MTDIGRVGMVMKGDYNSASTYEALDVVSYQNGLYVAKQSVPAGTVPTNTTYWQLGVDITIDAIAVTPKSGATIAYNRSMKVNGRTFISLNILISPTLADTAPHKIATLTGSNIPTNVAAAITGSCCDGNWNYLGGGGGYIMNGEVYFAGVVGTEIINILVIY